MHSKKFLPIIRCLDPIKGIGRDHAVVNAKTAQQYGADGIFLIGRGISASLLCFIYEDVRGRCPDLWIGVNFLDLSEGQAIELFKMVERCRDLNGLWLNWTPPNAPLGLRDIDVFGGVPLTFDKPALTDNPLWLACEVAARNVNVATISETADMAKLAEARKYLGNRILLAYAGAVTTQNVDGYLPYVDTFMVEYGIVGPEVETLADKIHAYAA